MYQRRHNLQENDSVEGKKKLVKNIRILLKAAMKKSCLVRKEGREGSGKEKGPKEKLTGQRREVTG